MVLLNCQLHWSVNLVVMSVFISSELGLNYILCIYYVCMYVYIIIYIYNIYIYIQSLLGCRMAPPLQCKILAMPLVAMFMTFWFHTRVLYKNGEKIGETNHCFRFKKTWQQFRFFWAATYSGNKHCWSCKTYGVYLNHTFSHINISEIYT